MIWGDFHPSTHQLSKVCHRHRQNVWPWSKPVWTVFPLSVMRAATLSSPVTEPTQPSKANLLRMITWRSPVLLCSCKPSLFRCNCKSATLRRDVVVAFEESIRRLVMMMVPTWKTSAALVSIVVIKCAANSGERLSCSQSRLWNLVPLPRVNLKMHLKVIKLCIAPFTNRVWHALLIWW